MIFYSLDSLESNEPETTFEVIKTYFTCRPIDSSTIDRSMFSFWPNIKQRQKEKGVYITYYHLDESYKLKQQLNAK